MSAREIILGWLLDGCTVAQIARRTRQPVEAVAATVAALRSEGWA